MELRRKIRFGPIAHEPKIHQAALVDECPYEKSKPKKRKKRKTKTKKQESASGPESWSSARSTAFATPARKTSR